MSDDLLVSARRWLRETGYPLELQVGRLFRSTGWETRHAQHYEDPREGKLRELDALATRSFSNSNFSVMVDVSLAIECKSSKKPWIALSSPVGANLYLDLAAGADSLSRSALFVADVNGVQRAKVFTTEPDVAHGIVQAHGSDSSSDPTHPFSALAAVLSACVGISRPRQTQLLEHGEGIQWISIVAPLIVLDGVLLQYSLADDGSDHLREVDWVSVVTASPVDGHLTVVRIVRWAKLPAFVETQLADVPAFGTGMIAHAKDVYYMERGRVSRQSPSVAQS